MIIAGRFNGPPGSGNGGYSAGLFATHLPDGQFEITLRRPPPLDTPLSIQDLFLYGPERTLIAEAKPASVAVEPVSPVTPEEAAKHSAKYHGFTGHPFPTCYVCGPDRPDGLRIFSGPVGDGRTAAPWLVPPDISRPTVWAALDCPGGWAVLTEARPYVLGRMATVVQTLPEPGTTCVVMGESLGEEGRKAYVRSTLYGPQGTILAHANATWIAI